MKIKGIKKERIKTVMGRLAEILVKRIWELLLGYMVLLSGSKSFLSAFTYPAIFAPAFGGEDTPNACTNVGCDFEVGSDAGFDILFHGNNNLVPEAELKSFSMNPSLHDLPSFAEGNIRVLICNSNYHGIFHKELIFRCNTDLKITFLGEEEKEEAWKWIKGEDVFKISYDDPIWEGVGDGKFFKLRLETTKDKNMSDTSIEVANLKRSQSKVCYEGRLEIYSQEEGMVLVNELPLEEYLYGVVPGEMPASYPLEALKAQAVCARTYAFSKMQQVAYPEYGAHMDDSTSFQVYNNQEKHRESNLAVDETRGQTLVDGKGEIVQVYYYSTSCGLGSDEAVWNVEEEIPYLRAKRIIRSEAYGSEAYGGEAYESEAYESEEEFEAFIKQDDQEDYEYEEPWYRWSVDAEGIKSGQILKRMKECFNKDRNKVLTQNGNEYISKELPASIEIRNLWIGKRGNGLIARELMVETDQGIFKVLTEYNIRYVLNCKKLKVTRQDGSVVTSDTLLPSAFICLESICKGGKFIGYHIWGGGYGHGVGMSQNAAKAMAHEEMNYKEILEFFFEGCKIYNNRDGHY